MYYQRLAAAGGDPERWWVVTRPIPQAEWIEVIDMTTVSAWSAASP
jgi:hypothetical protein